MSELLALRDYQSDAISSALLAIGGGTTRPAVVLPTGSGKTVIFSHLAKYWRDANPTQRVLILVHRDELVTQAVGKLHDVAPELHTGIVKAEQNEVGAAVIVGSVQTLRSPARMSQIQNVGLVIVDEAHHAAAPSYISVLEHFGCFGRSTPVVGFSATLSRNDKGDLSQVWMEVVYQRDILDMIPKYLCDVRGMLVTVNGLSLSEVSVQSGDLAAGSLTEALLTSEAQNFVVQAYLNHARDRPTIVFTPTVEAAQEFTRAFAEAGIRVATVWGAMAKDERRSVLAQFNLGELDVIVNCMVLTEGFDEPRASCAIIARPTRSPSLYVQMVGRVLRKFPGKVDALVLDVVGASADHKLATLADLSSRLEDEVAEGETLMEAAIRAREKGNPDLRNLTVSMEDVDLFHRSASVWLRTYEGMPFIGTRCNAYRGSCQTFPYANARDITCLGHTWFLWPEDGGTFAVGVRSTTRPGGKFLREGLDLETAMSWAEQFATEDDPTTANQSASWRKRRTPATDAQRMQAKRLGLTFPTDVTKRDASDMISIHMVSLTIDKNFANRRKAVSEKVSA